MILPFLSINNICIKTTSDAVKKTVRLVLKSIVVLHEPIGERPQRDRDSDKKQRYQRGEYRKAWEKYAERGANHKHQHTQGHRQLHMAARFLFLEFERGLDSQSHEKKIQHRDAAAEQISEQHCVVPFADDQKYRLHKHAQNERHERDI